MDGVARPKSWVVTGKETIEVTEGRILSETERNLPRFAIAYEDDDVLVVDKPAGVIVHSGAGTRGATLVDALGDAVAGGTDPTRPGVIHRLDRNTSGLILFAKHQAAYEAINVRDLRREYLALVKGRPPARTGTIDAPLGRDRRNRTLRSSDTDDPREAITHFTTEETFPEATLLRVTLETGRTHQIRAHLKAIGFPVLGDPDYGVAHPSLTRQFLHAHRLNEWRSPLPEDLATTLEEFRNPTPDVRSPVPD